MVYSIEEIKQWRKQEYDAGRPSSLDDFYRAKGVCLACKGRGDRLFGNGTYIRIVKCHECNGTGKAPAITKGTRK